MVVFLLLVVRGKEGFLPTPPSWQELQLFIFLNKKRLIEIRKERDMEIMFPSQGHEELVEVEQ